jgi:Sugar (and other) transporter
VYWISAALMVVAAAGSVFAPSLDVLVAFRFLLGFAVGGDYPVSAVLMSEYSGRANRGRMVSLVFSAQAARRLPPAWPSAPRGQVDSRSAAVPYAVRPNHHAAAAGPGGSRYTSTIASGWPP